ncbi:MAG: ATP-binding protein [Gemmatimonadetes bacterium]|nr:ATP-binding protein [Gemmatimonadota bacterium]
MKRDPTFVGTVQSVTGTDVTVELGDETVTGLSFVAGAAYRIGQVGTFVRIPMGFASLFGVVSQVGAGAAPLREDGAHTYGNRWLRVQLIGESGAGGRFARGISQHPTIDDRVHIVTEDDLKTIYGPSEPSGFVTIGTIASAAAIPALVDVNRLVTRHSAVVGSTGAGKSTTVSAVLRALSNSSRYPSSRVLILDMHGEYARALGAQAAVFRVSADASAGEIELRVPFWALTFDELVAVSIGAVSDQARAVIADSVLRLKKASLEAKPRDGIDEQTLTVDSPVPFSIHELWFELHKREHVTTIPKPGAGAEEVLPAYLLGDNGAPVQLGDAMSVTAPLYRTVKTTGAPNERVQWGKDSLGIRQQVGLLASRLRDPRLAFLFSPGEWLPDKNGLPQQDLDELLRAWIGHSAPVTILDLSGVPSAVLGELVGAVLRVLYDALFWARNLPEGGRERPLLVVLEEAHAYLGRGDTDSASSAVRRIAKEGRKYGVGLMLVSQRPSELDPTVLSQCGTIIAMRLSNESDRGHITSAAPENLHGLFDMLPALRTGEAIVVGEAVSLPMRVLIERPPDDRMPDSVDPRVSVGGSEDDGFDGPGGWNQRRDAPRYDEVLVQWRKQNVRYEHPAVVNATETSQQEHK